MSLRSIRIQNYRAIRDASLTFEETTVLFGENDCGRSSILEALALILGSPDETFESLLKPFHFHLGTDGAPGPLQINLRVCEDAAGTWKVPERLKRILPEKAAHKRELLFEFRADLDPATQVIERGFRFVAAARSEQFVDGDSDALAWLRDLVPVLWLRSGLVTGAGVPRNGGPGQGMDLEDPALIALELHHRNLLRGAVPDLGAELDHGARAAQEVLRRYRRVFAGAGPLMSAMASDILNSRQRSAFPDSPHNTAAYKIAVLLLLGAILALVRRGPSAQASPILIIENPESNLHPMTLAAAWRIVERIVWQKIITTNSSKILSSVPLGSLRRITRFQGRVTEWTVQPRLLSKDTLRRVSYHLRSRRAVAMFARCWLLVEGETEYWIVPELARLCGHDFAAEGVECVEFAQCGLTALIKLADHLGIAWHVLSDGDDAGLRYSEAAMRSRAGTSGAAPKVTRLRERDIEHCFWENGFDDVIRRIAYPGPLTRSATPGATIRKAIERTSKPHLALSLIDAVAERGTQSIPPVLKKTLEAAIASARSAPDVAFQRKSN